MFRFNKVIVLVSFLVILTVIAIILIPTLIMKSLNELNHDQYGIAYNKYSREIDNKLYDEGRYYLPIPSEFFTFTKIVQSLYLIRNGDTDNRIMCLSKEGLEMRLGVTVQYQINKDDVFEIFQKFGKDEYHLDYFEHLIRQVIKDNCPIFTGSDYYHIRSTVEHYLEGKIKQMALTKSSGATIILIQLTSVNHPASYDAVNELKQQILQEKQTLLIQRNESMANALTELLTTQAQAEIKLMTAESTRTSLISNAYELSQVETNKWTQRVNNFRNLDAESIIKHLEYIITSTKQNIIWQNKAI